MADRVQVLDRAVAKHDAVLRVELALSTLRGLVCVPDSRSIVRMDPAVHPVDRRQRVRRLDAPNAKHLRRYRERSRREMVPPAAGVAQSLRFEQIGLAPPQLLLGFLARMDVREQVVPADDPAVDISKREPARLEPPVLAIAAPDPVLEFVRQSR